MGGPGASASLRRDMSRLYVVVGALSAGIAVAAGAFGAHALRARVGAPLPNIWETAARYQMYHALALLFLAWLMERAPGPAVRIAGWAFVVGTVLFSGSLYLMTLTGATWLGAITPLGGVAFLIGWGAVAWGVGARA